MTGLYGDRLGAEVVDGQVRQFLTLMNREPVLDRPLPLSEYVTNRFLDA